MSGEVGQQDQSVQVLDASGLSCPLPLLKAKQALNRLNSGELLRVIATDAGSVRDFKAFTDQSGDKLLESLEQGGSYIYLIEKA
ncbi:sulfurtransferase TusA family protein [Motiliproteus sp.]|uniref:sulfurtransferase TusA family protein n=1 Tax=Motiliproteus sp. TaxID=1898955 RepID=UPI003BA95F41